MKRHAQMFACLASVWAISCAGPLHSKTRARGVLSQGVTVKAGTAVLYGSASNTTKPATIDYRDVERRTPEYRTSRSEGVRRGSARSDILISQMKYRIKEAVALAARSEGVDCVVRKGDIKDANGLAVMDLTDQVIAELESGGPTP